MNKAKESRGRGKKRGKQMGRESPVERRKKDDGRTKFDNVDCGAATAGGGGRRRLVR
jgi:hypothetical protein